MCPGGIRVALKKTRQPQVKNSEKETNIEMGLSVLALCIFMIAFVALLIPPGGCVDPAVGA